VKPALLSLGTLCMLTVSLAAQSLGDVAKKAEEERKVKQASKAYTDKDLKDKDLKSAPGPVTLTTATSAPVDQREGDRADEYRKIAKKDEAYWKERMRNAQSALDSDRTFLAAAIVREKELAKRLDRGAGDVIRDGRLRARVDSEWEAAVTEVSRLTATVETDRLAIAALEDEARRANVPPGWLRP